MQIEEDSNEEYAQNYARPCVSSINKQDYDVSQGQQTTQEEKIIYYLMHDQVVLSAIQQQNSIQENSTQNMAIWKQKIISVLWDHCPKSYNTYE